MKVIHLCPTLCDPMDYIAHQAPLSMGLSQQEYWSGLSCPPPGDLPNRGIKPRSPTLQANSLPDEHKGKPLIILTFYLTYFFILTDNNVLKLTHLS